MRELKCPKCGNVFSVDEADYAAIVGQVRSKEFDAEVNSRVAEIKKQNELQQEANSIKISQEYQNQLNSKQTELSNKDKEILQLKAQLESISQAKQLEFNKERMKTSEEISRLKSQIAQNDDKIRIALMEEQGKFKETLQGKENDLLRLKNELELKNNEAIIRENNLKEGYERQLKEKQEMVDYYKDLKAKLSTKMVGETLEAHCEIEFNRYRTTMFPNAYFDKDNDSASGSKGDYIFKDYDEEHTEYISIMFEMKNEMDTTATKHKNEHFFEKLDKDRREKGCEYAVLVSLLEQDNEFYNGGIVDVSYRYPKMYVVRPQFFLPIISLLSQASKNTIEYKKELIRARQQSVDITNFENKINDFKEKFGKHYTSASAKFMKAVDDIDKAIKNLQDMKKELLASENYLRLANNDTDDLTIKKLTRGNPTMKKMFEDARIVEENKNNE